ncbi:hypothetical protein BPMI_02245 [Candidatus Burkholderia pumila]|uniref:KfrA N-terminal DNA-binding domain-containing protein n=1 Tax=Candidatus Burkholderia pumila TaxID=1090375 RepID=A0ABR5HKT5_9BURK|nr:hypothetical protein BPMI_02245 [Candidatus Burkholderia pumila]
MAREANITQDQVSRAAEAIRDAGAQLTVRAIRERLGAGSMATVLKFFQAWRDAQVKEPEAPVSLPPTLQRGLLEFVSSEVDSAKGQLRAELEIVNQANADLIIESDRQALVIENLTGTLETVYGEKAEITGRLEQVLAERYAALEESTTERQTAESARTELAKALLRLEMMPRLEKEIDNLRRQVEAESSARVTAEQAAAVAVAKLEASIDARAVAAKTIDEAKAEYQVRGAELLVVRSELHEARATIDELRTKLARSRGTRATLPVKHEERPRRKT